MRRAVIVFAAIAVLAVAALLVVAAGRDTRLAFTLGVVPGGPVVTLAPGQTACQGPIDVPRDAGFDTLTVPLGTFRRAGPRIEVAVRQSVTRAPLAGGVLPSGYPDIAGDGVARIPVSPAVRQGTQIDVCLRNAGRTRVAVFGNAGQAAPSSALYKNDIPVGSDASLRFETQSRSALSRFGVSARYASLFKAGWVGPWTFWLLAALCAIAVPLLIAVAIARAGREE